VTESRLRFPALAVAPAFQAAGRNAVQVGQVSRIALAVLARRIAAVNVTVRAIVAEP